MNLFADQRAKRHLFSTAAQYKRTASNFTRILLRFEPYNVILATHSFTIFTHYLVHCERMIFMPDMLVKLYTVDQYDNCGERIKQESIEILPAMAPNLTLIRDWITQHFQSEFAKGWPDEATKAILASPSSCFLAVRSGKILGFACYDATAKGFFGPTGVDEAERGKGIGQALLMHTLSQMYSAGYAYAVIGGVGPAKFYERCCGAVLIEGSAPGYYKNLL